MSESVIWLKKQLEVNVYNVYFSSDEALTSYSEFTVQKESPRHTDVVRRTLCLTETCLVERDPATYNVTTCKPLCDVSLSIIYVKTTLWCKSLYHWCQNHSVM